MVFTGLTDTIKFSFSGIGTDHFKARVRISGENCAVNDNIVMTIGANVIIKAINGIFIVDTNEFTHT
jgi:hypothetical protein